MHGPNTSKEAARGSRGVLARDIIITMNFDSYKTPRHYTELLVTEVGQLGPLVEFYWHSQCNYDIKVLTTHHIKGPRTHITQVVRNRRQNGVCFKPEAMETRSHKAVRDVLKTPLAEALCSQ